MLLGWVGRRLTAPELRRLRWIVGVGLAVRLLLAPVTSWDFDTPEFVLSGLSTLFTGSPYSSSLWSNPPLGPFLSAPLLAIPVWLYGAGALVPAVSAIVPVTSATGVNATLVPLPLALLAWKLPFLLCDLGVAAALYLHPRWAGFTVPFPRDLLAAVWFLNPLVIWSSSVHGEVDALAALLVLLGLAALLGRFFFAAGLFLGLGFFAKGYPLVLLPLLLVVALLSGGEELRSLGSRLRRLGAALLGVATSSLPFLGFLPQTWAVAAANTSNPQYGGISVLAVFNRASPHGGGWYALFAGNFGMAADGLLALRVLSLVAMVGGAVLVAYRLAGARAGAAREDRPRLLLVAALWAVSGALLADSAPQAENLLAVLPLILLALPDAQHRRAWWAFALLSAAGTLLYWSLFTPVGMFYPLARAIGPSAILWVNGVVLAYVHTPLLRGTLWLAAGLLGGGCLLYLWAAALLRLLPAGAHDRLLGVLGRHARTPLAPPV